MTRYLWLLSVAVLAGCRPGRPDRMSAESLFYAAERRRAAGKDDRAFDTYALLVEKHPDTIYTVKAMGRMVDYHVYRKDYRAAEALLERIFSDYPESPYLDAMAMRWVIVAYRMGDLHKAREKCREVISQHPTSKYRATAEKALDHFDARLGVELEKEELAGTPGHPTR